MRLTFAIGISGVVLATAFSVFAQGGAVDNTGNPGGYIDVKAGQGGPTAKEEGGCKEDKNAKEKKCPKLCDVLGYHDGSGGGHTTCTISVGGCTPISNSMGICQPFNVREAMIDGAARGGEAYREHYEGELKDGELKNYAMTSTPLEKSYAEGLLKAFDDGSIPQGSGLEASSPYLPPLNYPQSADSLTQRLYELAGLDQARLPEEQPSTVSQRLLGIANTVSGGFRSILESGDFGSLLPQGAKTPAIELDPGRIGTFASPNIGASTFSAPPLVQAGASSGNFWSNVLREANEGLESFRGYLRSINWIK